MTVTERMIMTMLAGTDFILQGLHQVLTTEQDESEARSTVLPMITYMRAGDIGVIDVYGNRVSPSVKTALVFRKTGISRVRNLLRERKNAAARDKIETIRAEFGNLFDAAAMDTGFDPSTDAAVFNGG